MFRAPPPHPLNRMKVAPVRVYGKTRSTYVDTYAALDTAAGHCICSRELMELLDLPGEEQQTSVITATGTIEASTAHKLTLAIQGYRTEDIYPIRAIALETITDLTDQIPSQADVDRHPHMRGLRLPDHPRKRVDILICIGESHLHHAYDTRTAAGGQLWATCTGLGWVVHGRDEGKNYPSPQDSSVRVNAVQVAPCGFDHSKPHGETEILEKVREIYAIEFSEPQHSRDKVMSRQAQVMHQRQKETFARVNGRCQVGKLWRKSPHTLRNNRWMAEKSLRQLGRRLRSNPQLLKNYQEFIRKLLENDQSDIPPDALGDRMGYFLLHHPVLDKFRVVFNGAHEFLGECLNDYLDKGPEHTSALLGTLLRFREGRYAATADIKGMFYNVRIPVEDCNFMRFLWFEDGDPTKEIVEYRLTHQVPGLTDSPSNAGFALRQIAKENISGASAETCQTINQNFYVDDLCKSGHELLPLKHVLEESRTMLHNDGGFNLTKFIANHPALISDIPEKDHLPTEKAPRPEAPELHKALGVWWNTSSDELLIEFPKPTQDATRRGILSYIMSPFDPSGIALPYLLEMKLLVQRLFKADCSWDTPLTGEDLDCWSQWVEELPTLKAVHCQRALIPQPGFKDIRLCVFTDASERGYAAVAYIVCQYDNDVTVRFALGKVRVAPKKKLITIPRLELLAAVLGVEVAATVKAELNIAFHGIHFWTDSTCVLRWVKNPELQLKQFVANRVSKVIEGSEGATWFHVRTHENPADVGSRGLRPTQPAEIRPWLEGPSWLKGDRDSWPSTDGLEGVSPSPQDLEVKKVNAVNIIAVAPTQPLCNLFARYSTLAKLRTTTAWLMRLRQVLSKKTSRPVSAKLPLTPAEEEDAVTHLVRASQWAAYPVLMQALEAQPPLAGKSLADLAKKQARNMRQLAPFLDEHGLLRVGGRLQRAGLRYETTHPCILPKRHELTGLLIQHAHEQSHHRGYNFVLAQLREKYWVIGGSRTVRHYLGQCIRCRHARAKLGQQQMAPLPPSRFATGVPAFTYTAVDYFGPLYAKLTRRTTMKRWGCLLTCLTTRAVHLEYAYQLTTDSFLMAFRRFTSVYPSVKEMLSDNGTNFVGADPLLKAEFLEQVDFGGLAQGLRKRGVSFRWKFNPPCASHQGGVFERMIGLVRSCLRHTMQDVSYRTPSDEELLTMLKGIQGILNLRPLLPAGSDPDSFDVLTPAQILRPGTPAQPVATRSFARGDSLRKGYRATQWHVDEFWRRFSTGYIPMLQKRAKWLTPHRNHQVGDLVLIQNKDAPRHQWKMALVKQVHPNKEDNLVRRVTLRQAEGQDLIRDVRYICLLEASPELERLRSP